MFVTPATAQIRLSLRDLLLAVCRPVDESIAARFLTILKSWPMTIGVLPIATKATPVGIEASFVGVPLLLMATTKVGGALSLPPTKAMCFRTILVRAKKPLMFFRIVNCLFGVRPSTANCRSGLKALTLAVPRPVRATSSGLFLATANRPVATIGRLPIGVRPRPIIRALKLLLLLSS